MLGFRLLCFYWSGFHCAAFLHSAWRLLCLPSRVQSSPDCSVGTMMTVRKLVVECEKIRPATFLYIVSSLPPIFPSSLTLSLEGEGLSRLREVIKVCFSIFFPIPCSTLFEDTAEAVAEIAASPEERPRGSSKHRKQPIRVRRPPEMYRSLTISSVATKSPRKCCPFSGCCVKLPSTPGWKCASRVQP